jgi:cell division protein FtsZ
MGIGKSSGDDRAVEAAKAAINSPLLELSIDGAQGVLFNVSGGDDLTMSEIGKAAKIITESIEEDAKVIFGAVTDENLKKGQLKVTVIATGFDYTDTMDNNVGRETPLMETQKEEDELEQEDEFEVPAFLRQKIDQPEQDKEKENREKPEEE